ncbi:AH receptor-interacting protein-like isoform X2 [Liolophura sinensis]|uniref:AH receptor-interacting protein-like isoform X2 n=1 Tax=Liolophura sinensis TaxID=3198878 RepID=UPI0031587934
MAEILATLQKQGIYKRILHGGEDAIPVFSHGSKATFHYRTTLCNEDKTVLDDSRRHDKPMELIFGKQFKLSVWETCLKSMKVKEVAEFTVESKHVDSYPVVAKSLRDIYKKHDHNHSHDEEKSHHCCGMMSMAEKGMGYEDLDNLVANPQPLTFTLELLKLEADYDKEAWEMSDEEKIAAVPQLREEGNTLYKNKQYDEAVEKYTKAIGILEQLLLREKPGDEAWVKLNELKVPLLLNFAQCKLVQKDYYPVIEHTSTVLDQQPGIWATMQVSLKQVTATSQYAEQ